MSSRSRWGGAVRNTVTTSQSAAPAEWACSPGCREVHAIKTNSCQTRCTLPLWVTRKAADSQRHRFLFSVTTLDRLVSVRTERRVTLLGVFCWLIIISQSPGEYDCSIPNVQASLEDLEAGISLGSNEKQRRLSSHSYTFCSVSSWCNENAAQSRSFSFLNFPVLPASYTQTDYTLEQSLLKELLLLQRLKIVSIRNFLQIRTSSSLSGRETLSFGFTVYRTK